MRARATRLHQDHPRRASGGDRRSAFYILHNNCNQLTIVVLNWAIGPGQQCTEGIHWGG
jgi:hypothetical protein